MMQIAKISYALPTYSRTIIQLIREIKQGFDSLDPIIGEIRNIPVIHRGKMRQVSEPTILETSMRKHEEKFEINLEMYTDTDIERFRDFACNLYEAFSGSSKKDMFEFISQTTEATENVHDASGQNIWDATLDMVKCMRMHFDNEGNHNYRFYVHPETYEKLAQNPPSPEQQAAMDELIKNKRKEYYAQKRTRRLS